ncbi:hypothetical protein DFA_09851 [Cavenderia fasciculata]|uniref:UBR-type domain-containing protein n=1 Tax=Cavenderia fasciculata TaxID=261658 RepID=F4QAW9_CACFS|nr:uncharacterized protein DFA_09851 [Cavenderia fasciculata]EGG15028.1 hypothetical protein DFA_09851 [Cavenderia fasciculata]|eukprot:XP_004351748.1 hypothetical protein DFA_09851 [Cavenderia fasciculata]
MSDVDPDLLLAIALSESLMVLGKGGDESTKNDDQEDDENNPNDNNNNKENNDDPPPQIASDSQKDRIYDYFVELVGQLKNDKIGNLTPLLCVLKDLVLLPQHIHYVTKVLELISFLIIDGKYGDMDVQKIYSFSKVTVEFCLSTLERWSENELDIDGNLVGSSTNMTSSTGTATATTITIKLSTPLILLSIIDMLCCIEFPSTSIDKSQLDKIPSFLNVTNLDRFVGVTESKESTSESKPTIVTEAVVVSTTSSPSPLPTSSTIELFNQFLNNGIGKESTPLISSSSVVDSGGAVNISSSLILDHDQLNEEILKSNTTYFNKNLRGASRLLAICSKLLPAYQTEMEVSEKFESFLARENLIYNFLSNVQDILFSEGFEQLDAASIPWTIDFIARLIGTFRSYQAYNLKALSVYEQQKETEQKLQDGGGEQQQSTAKTTVPSPLIKSKLLSSQVFENLFQVLGTKLNCPDLQIKAEIFFSLCILNDIEKMNIKIQDIMVKDSLVEKDYITWSPQLVILAISLIFDRLESMNNISDSGSINRVISPIMISDLPSTFGSAKPHTKFLHVSALDKQLIWFDYLSPKQYTAAELTSMFITPRLLDNILSILYISYFKLKDSQHSALSVTDSPSSTTSTPFTTPIKSGGSSTSVPVAPTKATAASLNESSDEGISMFGSLFESGPSLGMSTTAPPTSTTTTTTATTSNTNEFDIQLEGSYQSFINFVNVTFAKPAVVSKLFSFLNDVHLQVLSTILLYQSPHGSSYSPYIQSQAIANILRSINLNIIKSLDVLSVPLQEKWIDSIFDLCNRTIDQEKEKKTTTEVEALAIGSISPPRELLSLLGWIFVKRQQLKLTSSTNTTTTASDDKIIMTLWERFIYFNNVQNNQFVSVPKEMIIGFEYITFLLFSFHSLNEQNRLAILQKSVDIIHQIIEKRKSDQSYLPNSLIFSRFLFIFNYIIFNFDKMETKISKLFYESVLTLNQTNSTKDLPLSLVTVNYKHIIDQIKQSSSSSTLSSIPVFYEFNFNSTSSGGLSSFSTSHLQQCTDLFNRCSVVYQDFYRDVVSLCIMKIESQGQPIESLLFDYIITSACSLLRSLPPSNSFIQMIKDPSLFINISNETIIYLTYLHSILVHHETNKDSLIDIPWNIHTNNIIKLLQSNNNNNIRLNSLLQSILSYLIVIFDQQQQQSSSSSSSKNALGESGSDYMEGWESLFDDDDDEEDDSSDNEDNSDGMDSSDSDEKEKDEGNPSSASSSQQENKESGLAGINKQALLDMLPILYPSIVSVIKSVKSLYENELLSLIKTPSVMENDKILLAREVFSHVSEKSDAMQLIDLLGVSKEDRDAIEKYWGVEVKIDLTSIPKHQRCSMSWILHPALIYSDKTLTVLSNQMLLRSLSELSDLITKMDDSNKESSGSATTTATTTTASTTVVDSPMIIDSNQEDKKLVESYRLELSYTRADISTDQLLLFSKESQYLDIDSQSLLYIVSMSQISSFERVCQLLSKQSLEVRSAPVTERIINYHLDHMTVITKSYPSYFYCHYIPAYRKLVSPMGDKFRVELPQGDISQLLNFTIESEKVDKKSLGVLIQIMSLPVPQQSIVGGGAKLESLRSFAIRSILKDIPQEQLSKWFQEKLLGYVKQDDSAAAASSSDAMQVDVKQKLVPSTIEIQELIVKFIGILTGSNELAGYTKEQPGSNDKQPKESAASPSSTSSDSSSDEEEEENERLKKKKAWAKKTAFVSPPASSSPAVGNVSAAAASLIDWEEKVENISPLIYNILLGCFESAFTDWIDYPSLLKGYFGLLQYVAMKQHKLVDLFEQVSHLSANVLVNPTPSQLESLNLIVEFIENILKILRGDLDEDSMDTKTEQQHHHCHHTSANSDQKQTTDQEMGDVGNNLLLDDEEEVDDDEDSKWKASNSESSGSGADQADNEEDEARKLASKLCTYSQTKNDYMDQHWYFCYTCNLKTSEGCCSTCVKVCHKGHVVSYSRFSRFFCDCGAGAGKGGPCKALKPRVYQPEKKKPATAEQPSSVPISQPVVAATSPATTTAIVSPSVVTSSSSSSPSSIFDGELSQEEKKKIIEEITEQKVPVIEKIAELYPKLVQALKSSSEKAVTPTNINTVDVYAVPKKELVVRTDLVVPKKSTKAGVFDSKTKYEGGSEGSQLKNLVNAGLIQKRALASNSRGVVAVAEGENVSLVNVAKLVDEEANTVDRAALKTLSKSAIGFPVMSMVFNPTNDNFLAVVGARECKILTINNKDEIVDQLVIDLSLYSIGENIYIIKVDWVVGSQVELAVATNEFVKIYDLSTDNLSPTHFYTLVEDSIRDTAIIKKGAQLHLLALAESGMLYSQPIQPSIDDESCIMIETVQLPIVKQSPGVCLFSAPDIPGIFVTFTNGEAYMVNLDDSATTVVTAVTIQDVNLKVAMPSCYFMTLAPAYPTVVTALAARGGFMVSLKMTSTAEMHVQAIKMSSKVDGMTWVNKASPKMLVLFEDGTLTRYDYTIDSPLTLSSSISSASSPQNAIGGSQLSSGSGIDILSIISKQKQIKSSDEPAKNVATTTTTAAVPTSPSTSVQKKPIVSFPIDYFEKVDCITKNIKFGGDPLQSYSQDVIKQRLSNTDEYVVCQGQDTMTIIIYNNNPEVVICGIGVLVGNASTKHVPSELRVFDRTITCTDGMRRWYDIPLTNEEAIKSAKKLTLFVGPNASNSPIIDSIEVYGTPKDVIGYDEAVELGSKSSAANSIDSLNTTEMVLLRTLSCLGLYFVNCSDEATRDNAVYKSLKEKTTKQLASFMTDPQLSFLHPIVKDLLKILLPNEEEYLSLRHSTLLNHCSETISKMVGGVSTGDFAENLEHIILILKKISCTRPNNLTTQIFSTKPTFLADLINVHRQATSGGSGLNGSLVSEEVITNLTHLLWNCLTSRAFSSDYILGLVKNLLSHPQESIRVRSSIALVSLISKSNLKSSIKPIVPAKSSVVATTTSATATAADLIDEVHFSCDKCSVYPIQQKRYHCEVCGDFDLCSDCYLKITATKEHPQDHLIKEYLLDETMTDDSSSNKQVAEPSLQEGTFDEDLNAAIAMSLDASQHPDQKLVNEEDPFDNMFRFLLDELFAVLDKGFNYALPYAQVVYTLFVHIGTDLKADTFTRFSTLIMKQLTESHSNFEKYLTGKSLSLEGDSVIIILLSLLLDTDIHKQQHSKSSNKPSSSSSNSSVINVNQLVLPQTSIYAISENMESQGFMDKVLRYWLDHLYQVISSQVNYNSPETNAMSSPFGALLISSHSEDQSLPKSRFAPFFSKSLPSSPQSLQQSITKHLFKLAITFYRCDRHHRKANPSINWFTPTADWMSLTCSYIHSKKTTQFVKYPKKLLLLLATTKESYYAVRDEFLLKKKYSKIQALERQYNGFTDDIHYDHLIKLIGYLSSMLEVASTRPHSWQYFCTNNDILNGLFNNLFFLPEETSQLILELLTFAFVTEEQSSSSSSSLSSLPSTTKNDTIMQDSEKVTMFLQGDSLDILINNLLLEPNASDLRQNTSNFIYNLWKASDIDQKVHINKCLWSKLDQVVSYGKNSNEFMELLTYVINGIDPNKWKDQYNEFADKFIESFKLQNQCVHNHPNSQIYTSLGSILELDGYYLESEPCLVCNNPETQFQTVRIDSLKQEYKFTDSCHLIKFNGVYSIQKLQINIHDSKKARMIKTINLFYNNKTTSDIGELKGKFAQWKKLKQIHFAPNQTEKTIRFQIPIAATNFMIEYFDFHDNLQVLASEKLQCPRCSRTVTDKHGICKHCHENAFQCKQCRNINYENLEGFLCNECGFCKHARFDYQFTCKPTVSIEKIENQDDHKRAISTIDKESENAHKKYQRLIGFKRIISNLITSYQTQEPWPKEELFNQLGISVAASASSPPNAAASGAGGATTSASNPNSIPSLRINRKIGYLARLYEKECKSIFESLSKSVQILLNTRMEIIKYMNVLAKKPRSKEIKSRSSNNCFGCSNAYTEQSLSFLNHLSRNPQLVDLRNMLIQKGLTKELFMNNIYHGKSDSRNNARLAISYLTKNNLTATTELNGWISEKIFYAIENHTSLDLSTMISSEMFLLRDCTALTDNIWQTRFRFIMEIFFKSIEAGSNNPIISEYITLPCLKIILSLCTLERNTTDLLQKDLNDTEDHQKTLRLKFEKLRSLIKLKEQQIQLQQQQQQGGQLSSSASSVVVNSPPPPPPSAAEVQEPAATKEKVISTSGNGWNYFDQSESSVKFDEFLASDTFDQWANKYQSSIFNNTTPTTSPTTATAATTTTTTVVDKVEIRNRYLTSKYLAKWKKQVKKSAAATSNTNPLEGIFLEDGWVSKLLFNSTPSIRSETISLMNILSRSSQVRTYKFLDLFVKLIPHACKVGENSAEFFSLFGKIISSDERKIYLTVRGFLPYLCDLIILDIDRINSLETSFNTDFSQGYVLKTLVNILMSFVDVSSIKLKMKRDNLIEKVLDAFLSLRGVIIQKNKLTEDAVKQLQELMKSLNTESVEDNKKFMAANVKALTKHSKNGRTPIFIFEQLCNIVCPVKPEPVYQLVLIKSSTQEEYIRGSMKNPYASNTVGSLMRDIKNKICKTLDLGTFLEDDNGMELLVDNKIIKLDLPIKRVYEQVWKRSAVAQRSQDINTPMTVVYRLQGLDGEATEENIENLNDDNGEEKDPEVEFEITSIFSQCGGLEAMLTIVDDIADFSSEKELAHLVIKLLFHSCKIKVNREQLITHNGIGRLLEKLKTAFHQPDLAETLLLIIESIVTEANRSYLTNSNSSTSQITTNDQHHKDTNEAQEQMTMFLDKLASPLVRNNTRIIQAMTRIIPFLTYGHSGVINSLIDFFQPYLNFDEYDAGKKTDPNVTAHVDFFTKIADFTRPDENGSKLRQLVLERGITKQLYEYIDKNLPSDKDKSSPEWIGSLERAALPYVLVLLKGLANGHEPTQLMSVNEFNVLKRLHLMEQTSTTSTKNVGSLAENFLESLQVNNKKMADEIHNIRTESKREKLAQAEKHRENVLKELGLSQQGKHITANVVPTIIEDLEDEEGFTCMVCREGYNFKPDDVLGIYTYSKRVALHALNETTATPSSSGQSERRESSGGNAHCYTTVTHFNIIHYYCHRDATKADKSMKVPKEEWEGAALRNQQTKCNNIFPIQGPKITNDAFTPFCDKYWTNLNNVGRIDGSNPRFRLLAHDLKLLFLRFAKDESFSTDSKGGGKDSNIRIVPFFIQFGNFLLDQKIVGNQANQVRRPHFDKLFNQFVGLSLESSINNCTIEVDNVPYYLVLSLYLQSLKDWKSSRLNFLSKLIAYAFSEKQPANKTKFAILRPWLLFFTMIDKFHEIIHPPIKPEASSITSPTTSTTTVLEPWIIDTKTNLASHYLKIQQDCKSFLSSFEEEYSVFEEESEFFDDLGLLKEILALDSKDSNTYINNIEQLVKQKK